jgi:hypothetical protein
MLILVSKSAEKIVFCLLDHSGLAFLGRKVIAITVVVTKHSNLSMKHHQMN